MKYGLSEAQLKEVTDTLATFPAVEVAILFGSRAIDTFKEASDVDIAIKGKKATYDLALSVKDHLEEETNLPFFFDIISYQTISSEELKRHIRNKGKLIYRRGWREVKLGDIISLQGGGTPKTSVPEFWNGDIPWLSVADFNDESRFVYEAEKKITKLGLQESRTSLLQKGDVIISARGTVGALAQMSKPMAFNQSCYGIMGKKSYILNDYLYYLLKVEVQKLKSLSHGAVFDTITKETFSQIGIIIPPITKQKTIAEMLSSLDDKIDLLRQQNRTLEGMAQAFFKKSFLGKKDKNWKKKPLDEVAHFLNGVACQKFPPKEAFSKLPVLKIKELKSGISDSSDWATSDIDKKYIVDVGDVIFSWSGSLVLKMWGGERCILNQHLFKVTSGTYPKWFYYFWTKHHMEKFITIAESKKTTMGHIKRSDLSKPLVFVPTEKELECMNNVISVNFEKIILNTKKIKTLRRMCSFLLPKFIGGEFNIV